MVTGGSDSGSGGIGGAKDRGAGRRSNVIPFPTRMPGGEEHDESSRPQSSAGDIGDEHSPSSASTSSPSPIRPRPARRRHRRETVLLAELRGWVSISEKIGAAQAERALSNTIDRTIASLAASGAEERMIEGDPTQPAISGVFPDPDSCVRALRAAADLRHAVAEAQFPAPAENQFRIGIGLDSGDVTSITNEDDVTFEAVGPVRMFAAKLRDFAGAGQIFMSAAVYLETRDLIHVQSLGQVRVNAHGDTREAFSLTGFQDQ